MYHSLPPNASFWPFLVSVDEDLAETAQTGMSLRQALHCANYPRKPRGGPDTLSDSDSLRFSFCCEHDGCRKRTTPPSVRFPGRKVYLAVVVILVAAMRHGPTPRRVRELSGHFGADRRTIARWQVFWRKLVPNTPFWKVARARLATRCRHHHASHPSPQRLPPRRHGPRRLEAAALLPRSDHDPGRPADQALLEDRLRSADDAPSAPRTAGRTTDATVRYTGSPASRGALHDPNTPHFDRHPLGAVSLLHHRHAVELSPCAGRSRPPSDPWPPGPGLTPPPDA